MNLADFNSIDIPDVPGVYRFLNSENEILYIGKATSLKTRIRSYFDNDLIETRGRRLVDMVAQAQTIDFDVTPSVLEALILEAELIRKYLPKYNSQQKDNKSYNYVIVTNEDFPRIETVRGRTLDMTFSKKEYLYSFGPFPSGGSLREALKIIRTIFPYRDKACTPAQEQVKSNPRQITKPCFNYHIGLCPGVCIGAVTREEYMRNIRHIVLFFNGKKKQLIASLEKEMMTYADVKKFEQAARIKKAIFSLDHINDIALIKQDYIDAGRQPDEIHHDYAYDGVDVHDEGVRIEAYDIAHLGGKEHVGVMVVVKDGIVEKAGYRKFKIQTVRGANDIAALREVLARRLQHAEWPAPYIIVMDGALPQRNVAVDLIAEFKEKQGNEDNFADPVIVSVVKDRSHKAKDILGDAKDAAIVSKHKPAILLANAEAHRFAIAYHRQQRNKRFRSPL